MNREKQIEEMCDVIASMICEIYNPLCDEYEPHTCSHCYANSTKIGDFAEMLYNAGYHKRSDVAKEIFDEIERILSLNYCCCLPQGATEHYEYYEGNIAKDITEIKNKYIGE